MKGGNLLAVTTVTFTGGATAAPDTTEPKQLAVTVPAGARSGPLTVADAAGQVSGPSPTLPVALTTGPKLTTGPIATGLAIRRAYVGGLQPPTLTYQLSTPRAAAVTVTVVRLRSGKTVATLDQGTVEPGETHSVGWGAKAGTFRFVVSIDGAGVTASTAQQTDVNTFTLRPAMYPIRGAHRYGDPFGAARGGHTHEGQDIFARCGTPLVAARGGTVKANTFQSAAGNYLVVDVAGSPDDQVYMHMRDAALPAEGVHVYTGELIGYVGDTGDASDCHLHFEEWSAPGWYSGGAAFDPLPDLKVWDRYS